MIDGKTKAVASPTKDFFVRMITRDIGLDDCILDLIDNSIDGAWSAEGSHPMGLGNETDLSAYQIEIEITPERFRIRDNCGGMTLDTAADYAFSFGRKTKADRDDFSIGVYGIGMKRAVFKLGSEILVRSTFSQKDGSSLAFAVPINVPNWLAEDNEQWDFDIVDDTPLPANGVEIIVTSLTPGTTTSFNSPAFIQDLRRTISRDYALHLNRGLRINLNSEVIRGWPIQLRQSDDFVPMRIAYEDKIDGDVVTVEIIGGMAAPPPESVEPDESQEGDRRFGWYVVCNGRMVLAADKSSVIGWGTDNWPQWHYQYAGFIGVILFTSANAAALPLTTTKRSVDISSEVFLRSRPRMREVTKAWIAYTNQRKQALEEAKKRESAAVAIPLSSIQQRSAVVLPTLTPKPVEAIANINYSVSATKMRRLAKELGSINMTYRDVGLRTFDYTYNDLVGED